MIVDSNAGRFVQIVFTPTSRLEYNLQCFDCFLQKAISFKIFIIKPFGRLFFRQFITHIQQKHQRVIRCRSVQCHRKPVGLVHVPRGKDTSLFSKRPNQNRVTLEIDHADLTVSRQPQILSGNVHDNGKPFSVAKVPEHPKAGILGKELFTGGAEGFADVVFELRSIHRPVSFSLAPSYGNPLF